MGALHDGHLSLVRRSLLENDLTVLSIFVNPAQFAPHEDLATYPRTLAHDLESLTAQSVSVQSLTRTPSAVFLPSVPEMYPSGINQQREMQKGTFVEVKGYGEQMEGRSRPGFFRGVATVVTKLFNIIQPTNAYFGQKDVQQALLLRRLCRDLLLSHPSPERLNIVPTLRDPTDGLALSSRNHYLSTGERKVASILFKALETAEGAWVTGKSKEECIREAVDVIENTKLEAEREGVYVRLDYIEMNESMTFEVLGDEEKQPSNEAVILSGAVWVGKTRLIDNLLIGDKNKILG
jgi:pantoate--beta-alanine ligase